jgi:hypothetical protein
MDTPTIQQLARRRHELDQLDRELEGMEKVARELEAQLQEARGILRAAEDDLLRDDLARLETMDGCE